MHMIYTSFNKVQRKKTEWEPRHQVLLVVFFVLWHIIHLVLFSESVASPKYSGDNNNCSCL